MTTINLKTNDLVVTATTKPTIATGGVASIQIIVDFNSTWDGYSKSAIFYTSKNPTPYEVVLTGGTNCKIPKEVLLDECILYIGLKGVKSNGAVKASAVVKYRVVPGSPTVVISDPSDDVYNQILAGYGATSEEVAKNNYSINVTVDSEADSDIVENIKTMLPLMFDSLTKDGCYTGIVSVAFNNSTLTFIYFLRRKDSFSIGGSLIRNNFNVEPNFYTFYYADNNTPLVKSFE